MLVEDNFLFLSTYRLVGIFVGIDRICIFHRIPGPDIFGQRYPDPKRILPHRIKMTLRFLGLQVDCLGLKKDENFVGIKKTR